MARKVFPSSPNVNDIFTSTKGKKFLWNGKVWKRTQDTNVESMTLDSSADEKLALHGSDNPTVRFREGSTDKGNLHWKASTGEMRLVNEESSQELRLGSSGVTVTGNLDVTGNLEVTGTTTFNGGTLTLGDSATDNVVFGADVNSSIIPNTDDLYDLGSASKQWRSLYIDGTANIDTLSVSGNGTVGGNLSVIGDLDVTGTLSYEDVTNIDSVGIVTARTGVRVTSGGITVSAGGANITGGITGALTGDVTGNSDTATTLETSRTLSISGAGTGSASFNGGANADIALTLANSGVTAATYGSSSAIPSITVDAKGLITSASTTAIDSTSISNGSASVAVASNGPITATGNLDVTAGVDVTGNITVSGTVDGRDVASDGSKLDGVESGATADQTASEILTLIKTVDGSGSGLDADTLDGVSSASFLRSDATDIFSGTSLTFNDDKKLYFGTGQDSQLYFDGSNLLVQGGSSGTTYLRGATVKISTNGGSGSYNTGILVSEGSSGYARVQLQYAGSTKLESTNNGVTVTGDIVVSSTVDGRDVASDGSKLDGIEASADVTDATNVNAAGAVMNSDTSTGSMSFVVDEDNMSSNSATKVPTQQSVKTYVDTEVAGVIDSAPGALNTLNELAAALGDDASFSTTVTNSIATKLPKSGGQMTGNITFSGSQTVDGRDLSSDGSKLDGIASGATNVTNNNQLTNGAGYITGFDITTQTDSKYLRSNTADTASGDITFSGGAGAVSIAGGSDIRFTSGGWTGEHAGKIQYHSNHMYIQYNSNVYFRNSGGSNVCNIDNSGNLGVSGQVTASSDVRLKKNITTIDNALDKVLNLRGVEFDYKENDVHSIGVIAQEVEEVLPDLVRTDEEDNFKSVAYGNLTAVLIEAVKELTAEVNTLKAELNTIKGK